MEEAQTKKRKIRDEISKKLSMFSDDEIVQKTKKIENRLFNFANFMEAKIALLYINSPNEIVTKNIIKRSADNKRVVILPVFDSEKHKTVLMKVDDLKTDLKTGCRGILEPDGNRCKIVPTDCVDIAIIPGIAFDEKGGRIGSGEGYYDRLIPKLSITTRKVSLAFEAQIIQQLPMEPHDKHVDIIITEKRIIYKI